MVQARGNGVDAGHLIAVRDSDRSRGSSVSGCSLASRTLSPTGPSRFDPVLRVATNGAIAGEVDRRRLFDPRAPAREPVAHMLADRCAMLRRSRGTMSIANGASARCRARRLPQRRPPPPVASSERQAPRIKQARHDTDLHRIGDVGIGPGHDQALGRVEGDRRAAARARQIPDCPRARAQGDQQCVEDERHLPGRPLRSPPRRCGRNARG